MNHSFGAFENFSDFVEDISRISDVANILLALRERLGFNTNILLYCCWVAKISNRQLRKKDLRHLLELIHPWSKLASEINILRQKWLALAKLKPQLEDLANRLDDQENHIKIHIEQDILKDALICLPSERSENQQVIDACKNISIYCQELAVGLNQDDALALKDLLRFIFPTADLRKITEHFGAFKNKRDRSLAYLQLKQMKLFEDS